MKLGLLLAITCCAAACLYGPASASAFCEGPSAYPDTAYVTASCTGAGGLGTDVAAVPLAPNASCVVANGLANAACAPIAAAVDAGGTNLCAGVPPVYVPIGGPTGPTTGPGSTPEVDVGVCRQ